MGSTGETITVASSVDAGFLPYVGPVATSMARFAKSGRPIDYRVFYAGPPSSDTKALDGYRVGPVTVRLLDAPTEVEKYRGRSVMGTETLVRMMAGELMPDLDRAVFLDVDLLLLADIAGLFDADLGGCPLGAVVDYSIYTWMQRQRTDPHKNPLYRLEPLLREKLGFTAGEWYDYVNAGVAVMDLAALRSEELSRQALDLLDRAAHDLPWPDQDGLNLLLKGRIKHLRAGWNVLVTELIFKIPDGTNTFVTEGIAEQRRRPHIIHFAGAFKPWLRTSHVPYSGTWWHFVAQSPLGDKIKTSFQEMRKVNHRVANPLVGLGKVAAGLRYGRTPATMGPA